MQLLADHDFTFNPCAPSRLRKDSRYLHENEEFQGEGEGSSKANSNRWQDRGETLPRGHQDDTVHQGS
jgi:hypothetical protein